MYRLRFLSSHHLEQVRGLVVERVCRWLDSWTLSSTELVEVDVRRVAIQQDEIGDLYRFSRCSLSHFRVSFSEVRWSDLIWGASAPTFASHDVKNAIISEVRSAFIREVLEACPSEEGHFPMTCSFSDMMELRIRFAELGEIVIYTRQSSMASVLKWPVAAANVAHLKDIYESIKDIRLMADVVLKFGEVPLKNFPNMKPGYVVESQLALANNFKLRLSDREVFDVSIGRRDAFVAVAVKGKAK